MGVQIPIEKCRDTLVLSKLFFPEQMLHSLDFYGNKFKRLKPVHEDWTKFSEAMLYRCTEDVEINTILYNWFVKKELSKWDWGKSMLTEQYFSYDQAWQEVAGVDVDTCVAQEIIESITQEMKEIDTRLSRDMPSRIVKAGVCNMPYKKDGSYSAQATQWFKDEETLCKVRGPFTKIKYEEVNLDSEQQVKKFLFTQGWVPTEWNYKKDKDTGFFVKDDNGNKIPTSPKLTEDSYASIKGNLGKLVARRNVIKHRRSFVGWTNKKGQFKGVLSYIRDDGKVPAEGILCEAVTGRTKHRNAVCNVPKAKKKIPYGIPIRAMYCVKDPLRVMLGADLDQIEARITAHYAAKFDGGEYWNRLLEVGDIHQYNADLLGVDRDPTAKAFQYAVFYGARAPKVATIVGCSVRKAQKLLDVFWSGTRGVYDCIQALEAQFDKYGFITGLDGRKLKVRAKYKLFNTLIQSAAAIIFKQWGVFTNIELRRQDVDCLQIIAYHDEFEYDCHKDHVDLASKIIKSAAKDAGESYNLYTPITVDVKVGRNWAEVH